MVDLANEAIVVALGGNLGGPSAVVKRFVSAIESISEQWGPARVSGYCITAPVGPVLDQPDFVNAVAAWWPSDRPTPEETLSLLQTLELAHGRERLTPGGARTLDLDLLLHGREVRDTPGLRVPHPRMGQRAFVLRPLRDLFGPDFHWAPGSLSLAALLADPDVQAQQTRGYVPRS